MPKISIILNIDEDHLDFFKDLDDIRRSFRKFAELLPADGTLIINGSIPNLSEITDGLCCNVRTFGLDSSMNYGATNIMHNSQGEASFDFVKDGEFVKRVSLSVNGNFNVENALASIAVADTIGISVNTAEEGLRSFTGTKRRFERKGEFNGINIIDDYAHHPTEIIASLKAARHFPHREMWCIFQPHTYTRTKALFNEFVEALTLPDHIILADIYAAREVNTIGISSKDVADALKEAGADVYYFPTFEEIENFCRDNCKKGDLLITMGAGDVVNIGENLLK